ncbi:MAG: molybdopterin biosynthesis protein [Thermodesulfobacteriota bacterium]
MDKDRNIYLQTIPIQEAIQTVRENLDRKQVLDTETVNTPDSRGRITAESIYARFSSPTFHSAAMDGIAVKAEDTFAAREGNPVELREGEDFVYVNTGDLIPGDKDSVIMIEQVEQTDNHSVFIEFPAFPWQHIRKIGEDIVATELLLPQNHRISSYDVGALLSAGIWEVKAKKRPHIHVIPSGDEVLDFETRPIPEPGEVIESNTQVLKNMAENWGCEVSRVPPVADREQALEAAVDQGLQSDAEIVMVCAGSSAGSKDFTRKIFERKGEILVHGISAMPGKPTLIAKSGNKLLLGAPGYPVSAVICFEKILYPILCWLQNQPVQERQKVPLYLTRKIPSKLGQEEFVRVSIGKVGENLIGTPLARGAGVLTSLTRAQGMITIPFNQEGWSADREIDAELFVPEEELLDILVCIGSHDNTLDLIKSELMGMEHPLSLASTHVGSLGGLQALQNRTAHFAGCHLYDPETRDYNFPFLQKYAPSRELKVINLCIRHQGLIVARGNPLGIRTLHDLTRGDVSFINRQRGAGTRILLDDKLRDEGINPEDIRGYNQEEFTHMAVAVNVATGAVDCAMGIFAAAKALDLEFIPLARERYDLILEEKFLQEEKVQTMLHMIRDEEFKTKIEDLGGYETHLTGEIMQPGQGLDSVS